VAPVVSVVTLDHASSCWAMTVAAWFERELVQGSTTNSCYQTRMHVSSMKLIRCWIIWTKHVL